MKIANILMKLQNGTNCNGNAFKKDVVGAIQDLQERLDREQKSSHENQVAFDKASAEAKRLQKDNLAKDIALESVKKRLRQANERADFLQRENSRMKAEAASSHNEKLSA